jgi:SAM-dependent methyltransferase
MQTVHLENANKDSIESAHFDSVRKPMRSGGSVSSASSSTRARLPTDSAVRSDQAERRPAMDESVLEYPACDLCACADFQILFTKKDTTSYWRAKCAEDVRLDPEMQFPLVRCTGCGHVFVRPRLKREINAEIYARFWRSHEPAKINHDAFATYLCRQLAELGQLGRLLDFGCGWGAHLAAARAVGWDALGIEVDSAKIAFVQKHALKAVRGDLIDGVFEASSFDAVIAQQVFEHLYDPARYLREIHRILKPGGMLFVGVPNYGGWQAKLYGVGWEIISPIGHIRYFTRRTLSWFLADHGFEIVRKRYIARFEDSRLKDLVYQGLVLAENQLNFYPHMLNLFARKL